MNTKILIIGQAPPFVKQGLPYDTTMLYDWLKEIGINKNEAQQLFIFDAVYDKFPGFDEKGGHKKPSLKQMEEYWERSLKEKVQNTEKIWILGNVAYDFLIPLKEVYQKRVIKTIHPSKRNLSIYQSKKEEILNKIKWLIYQN
jgi:uracil-DNA glycosylase